MAVKIFIKRIVPEDKAKEIIPLFREIRSLATNHFGYISGETLRSMDRPDLFLVISTWHSSEDWKKWMASEDRKKIQDKIDALLGGKTEYEIFHYGFSE
ncbi:MAG: antibiotic biosynthesis monooxygenase [Desulfobacteraceae bacterium]|nr:antibiotic biosynthesis monooxygenase [Desulfobacteraceae bacterium]